MSPQFKSIEKPHLFAHRGGNQAGTHLENTKKAFSTAINLGYKFLETDVIVTKDGRVICYHGSSNWGAKRISGLEIRRKLQKLTYQEIQDKAQAEDEKMPLLEEVLSDFPKTYFSIDVKTRGVISPAIKIIKRLKAEERVIITSFSLYRTLRANHLLRAKNKEASLCISRIGVLATTPLNYVFLPFLRLLGVTYLEVSHRRITKGLVSLARRNSMYLYAWTVNDREGIERMLALGVDGIMSDESKLLLETVKNKKA